MNYFLLAETEFFRRINEAGDCNMETAYTAFATQVIELCSGNVDTNRTIIALAYIEIELQHHPVRNLPEEKREVAAYISKALSFVRKMQKFLAAPQVPPLIPIRTSSDNTTENPASPLQWTGNAIDLVELIYGINEMGCINNGNMPLKQLALLSRSRGSYDGLPIVSGIALANPSRSRFRESTKASNKRTGQFSGHSSADAAASG